MDGIKITKRDTNALLRTLTSAIAANKDTEPIQQKWLMLYIAAIFKMRSSKNERQNYTQQQLISLLREGGIAEANIKNKTDYNHNKSYSYSRNDVWHHFEVQFKNYNVSFSDYRGGDATGSYRGINAYFFGRYHNVNLGFITAERAASTLMELDMLIPQWIEQEWPAFMFEAQKAAKIRNINENTIETLIKAKLDGTGITYHIEKQKLRVKTYFNIGCGMQVEWFLSHKNFMQEIDNVIKAVKIIKETAEATGTVCNIKKAMHEVEVCGRGGTNFQPIIDYAHSHLYDGLLIFTDGEAPIPKIPPHSRTKLLWVCQDDETFNAHQQWMKETGRVCVIYGRG